ncbi:hypothetical protein tloyanaT_13250 [Thalassotalea loyana]|uniref:Uncharacterized protein n=1 Tax=Thalassotalea loyana TaxID=280483 RepID=A0ABQ6HAC1_9GAMM|nr:hypothetical protein [Thalassotalea loyana]GLX85073.1 hypothetical protein tloyanaT_13250 [Thalassotalea loyana]
MSDELKALIEQKEAIEARCAHWKNSSGGSYEMALFNAGYYVVLEKIEKLKAA